jgi:hypothetical protein
MHTILGVIDRYKQVSGFPKLLPTKIVYAELLTGTIKIFTMIRNSDGPKLNGKNRIALRKRYLALIEPVRRANLP